MRKEERGIIVDPKKKKILIIAACAAVVAVLVLALALGHKSTKNTPQPGTQGGDNVVQDGDNEWKSNVDENGNYIADGVDANSPPKATPARNDCVNNRELSYTYDTYGHTITVGMTTGWRCDYLYINPRCNDSISVGYYMTSDLYYLELENGERPVNSTEPIGHPVNYEGFKGIKDFCILDRTYDTLNPAVYRSEDEYGARWSYDPLAVVNSSGHETAHVYIRAVEIASGNILAVLKLTISWVGDHYEMTSLESNDVYDTHEMSGADRDLAVDRSIEFLKTRSTMDKDGINKDYWGTARNLTLVEHRGPYFLNFYNDNNLAVIRRNYQKYDIYAVNITLKGYGFVTVYVTPNVLLQGSSKSAIDPNNLDLQVVGYDAFYPKSKSTLFANENFWINS